MNPAYERRVDRLVGRYESVEGHARWVALKHGIDAVPLVAKALATFDRHLGLPHGSRRLRAYAERCASITRAAVYRSAAEVLERI